MVRCLLVGLLLSVIVFTEGSRVRYDGYKVVSFWPEDQVQFDVLRQLSYDNNLGVWQEGHGVGSSFDVMLEPHQMRIFDELISQGVQYTTKVSDVQRLTDEVYDVVDNQAPVDLAGRINSSRFYNLSELYTWLDEQAACADCEMRNIGNSTEGRSIKVMKINSKGARGRAVWVDAGIHAREWLTPAVATYFIDKLIYDYDTDAEVKELRDNYDWYILSSVNPDGYDFTWTTDRMWRKTRSRNAGNPCIGTDANRNFDYFWEKGTDQPCGEIHRGASPASEPEVAAYSAEVSSISGSVDLAVTLHTYEQWLYRPWGHTTEDPSDYVRMEAVLGVGAAALNANSELTYGYSKTSGSHSGMSFDWVKGGAMINDSYLFELRDNGTYGFIAPPEEILPACVEVWACIHAMAMDLITP